MINSLCLPIASVVPLLYLSLCIVLFVVVIGCYVETIVLCGKEVGVISASTRGALLENRNPPLQF
jgi:hypothetical protein